MTTAEKVLCVEYPSKAIIVKGCANQAYEWTEDKFGYNELGDKSDGYTLKAHRLMDMHNNEIGRNGVNWYDTTINLSNNDIKSRVSDKLTGNVKTGIYWLHK